MKSLEQQLSEAQVSIVTLTTENKDLKESVTKLTATVTESKKAAVTVEVNAAIKEAGLNDAAATYIRKQFEGKDSTELLKEAVEAVKAHATAPVKRNNGGTSVDESDPAVSRAKLIESIKKNFGVSDKEAALMVE